MDCCRARVVGTLRALVCICILGALGAAGGCQVAPMASGAKIAEYRQQVDASGLVAPISVEPLKASIAPPVRWVALKMQKTLLYTHQQWRSPTCKSAVGITYIRLPFPMSTKTLAWFAGNEARKQTVDGKLIRQRTDSLGREWFEAETPKYHVTGYAMTRGQDAWINYCGYHVSEAKSEAEIELARRALETIIPLAVAQQMEKMAAK